MLNVCVIGTGNIGIDLTEKILKESSFNMVALVGRRAESPGLKRFEGRVPIFTRGLQEVLALGVGIDLVFDASSADSHQSHWTALKSKGIPVIDLTPSRLGKPTVPGFLGLDMGDFSEPLNYSMITCGGQGAVPIVTAFAKSADSIDYVEVSSSISAVSAGPATRANIDDYIGATENAVKIASRARTTKAILILNPSSPPIFMRTTVYVSGDFKPFEEVNREVEFAIAHVQKYVPGYRVQVPLLIKDRTVSITVGVEGAGDYLPSFAGNLDIMTAAAIRKAKDLFISKESEYVKN